MNIKDVEKELIKKAIESAEKGTSGEIVPVILKSSDFYPGAHFRAALIFSALTTFYCYLFIDIDDPISLIWSQIIGLILGYILAYLSFVKRLLITKREADEEVYQKALQLFFENKVSQTVDRTGILIVISLMERKIEVLADCGINSKVEENYWNDLVEGLSNEIKNNNLISGLCSAIALCGNKLEQSFPRKANDQNEIKDELIVEE